MTFALLTVDDGIGHLDNRALAALRERVSSDTRAGFNALGGSGVLELGIVIGAYFHGFSSASEGSHPQYVPSWPKIHLVQMLHPDSKLAQRIEHWMVLGALIGAGVAEDAAAAYIDEVGLPDFPATATLDDALG